MKKYGFWTLLLILLMLVVPGIGHADSVITHINLDGNELAISEDAQVQIVNGSVMVPLRLVAEQLGYAVKWDNLTKMATIEQGGMRLKLVVNETTAESSGRQIQLDTPPFLSGSITLVPLRFVGEETGTTVGWDNTTKTVYLTSPAKTEATPDKGEIRTEVSGEGETTTEVSSEAAVTSLSFSDTRLSITYSGRVTPSIFSMKDKDRIVVDLPNTRFSESFIQSMALTNKQSGAIKVNEHADVSAVRYSVFSNSPTTIRIVMDLNSAKAYSVIDEINGTIIVDLIGTGISLPSIGTAADTSTETLPPTTNLGKKLVVIDAGHGGKDPGGISINKRKEKDFTLLTALKIEKLLRNEPNIDIVLTRNDDSYPTLQERAKIANNLNADLFISIHANSIPLDSKNNPSGVETYYTRNDSLQFAETVHKYFVPATGLSNRGVRQNSLYVTRETKMPAILLECGYLSNANDEALLYNDDFQQRIAESVVAGIKEYLSF